MGIGKKNLTRFYLVLNNQIKPGEVFYSATNSI